MDFVPTREIGARLRQVSFYFDSYFIHRFSTLLLPFLFYFIRFEEIARARERLAQETASKKQAVAPLLEIEEKFKQVIDSFTTKNMLRESTEITKCMVAMKKAAVAANIAGGALVSKELFDKYMDAAIAPRAMELPFELRVLALEARHSHEGIRDIHSLVSDSNLFQEDQVGP